MNLGLKLDNQNNAQKKLKEYVAQGKRRLVAASPLEQQQYIDYRNLWKASTPNQQKQYKAIRQSGIMNSQRKATFIKFNYRYSEQKNLAYGEVYKSMFQQTKDREKKKYRKENKQNSCKNKYVMKNRSFIPLAQELRAKIRDGTLIEDSLFDASFMKSNYSDLQQKVETIVIPRKRRSNIWSQNIQEPQNQLTPAQIHSRNPPKTKKEEDWFDRFCEQKKNKYAESIETQPHFVPGSMNVCDLWGEKQLKESLGYLPCVRDRPKLLKMYYKEMQFKNKIKQTMVFQRTKTQT